VKTAWADVVYSFTTIDVPGATGGTSANGINNSGQIVGSFSDASGSHGFIDTGGSFTTIDVPGATGGTSASATAARSSGGYGSHGFLYSAGSFTTIDFPTVLVTSTNAFGINNRGQILGSYTQQSALGPIGFLDTDGNFQSIRFPGNTGGTSTFGINNSAQIVGMYNDSTGNHGFLDIGGTFTTIDVTGALATSVYVINNSGQIVGRYSDSTGNHGFLAAPSVVPEPRTLPLLAGCLIGLAMALRRRSKLVLRK
jgi:hypothetical protein